MAQLSSRRSGLTALALTALAALVIGCGGGGGSPGSTSSTTSTTSTTSATSTSTSTTGTTGNLGGGTDGGSGTLTANAIYYEQLSDAGYDVKYTTEDGSATGTYATGLSETAPAAEPDPSSAGRLVFAGAASTGTLGIYRNTTASTTGALAIVSPRYVEIDSIQVSRQGDKVVYIAAPTDSDEPHLYVAAANSGATPTLLDAGYVASADLSSDGTRVVYAKLLASGTTELYLIDLSAAKQTPVALTNDAVDEDEPQFSKDGKTVVFSIDNGAGRHLIGFLSAVGGAITPIDPDPTVSARAPSFNSDGSRVAFITESDDATKIGIETCKFDGTDLKKVLNAPSPLPRSLYWTNATGRAAGGVQLHLGRPRPRK